jgi:putative tricarboxylic transport membrane protein
MHITYLPGGIGAVAWHSLVSQRRAEPNTLVAFSGGSLLNLAQGKFGKVKASDVRWVAAGCGLRHDRGARRFAYKTLGDLMAALSQSAEGADRRLRHHRQPGLAEDGAGVKAPASIRKRCVSWRWRAAAKPSPPCMPTTCRWCRAMPAKPRCMPAMARRGAGGAVRAAPAGVLANVPTAREQGVDVVWPIIRGVWMGPQVPDADYRHGSRRSTVCWPAQFAADARSAGLYPLGLTGDALAAMSRKPWTTTASVRPN